MKFSRAQNACPVYSKAMDKKKKAMNEKKDSLLEKEIL